MTPSKEDYLRTMLLLSAGGEELRSVDIALSLGVSAASVSRMMNILVKEKFIMKKHYGTVRLTDYGRDIAGGVQARHVLLRSFLVEILGVGNEVAELDACRMEHLVSAETMKKLSSRLCFLKKCVKGI